MGSSRSRSGYDQAEPVVGEDRVPHAEDEGASSAYMFLLAVATTSRVASLRTVISQRHLAGQRVRGAAEARVVGAEGHLDHVEHAFLDLACRRSSRPSAAFLSDIEMAALLLVVPTIRLTAVTMPFSSVL